MDIEAKDEAEENVGDLTRTIRDLADMDRVTGEDPEAAVPPDIIEETEV